MSPEPQEAERCLAIRKRALLGEFVSDDERAFLYRIHRHHPEWLAEIDAAALRELRRETG